MRLNTNKPFSLVVLVVGIAGSLIYIFFLQGFFPLPSFGFLLPERVIITSTLPLNLKWSIDSGDVIVSEPFVMPNRIIVRSSNSFIGLDEGNGQRMWDVRVGGYSLTDVYLSYYRKNLVVAARGNTGLDSIDSQSGRVYWAKTITGNPNFISALTTDGVTIFVGLNRASQSVQGYTFENGIPSWSPDPDLPGGITPSPLIIQDHILYVFQGDSLYLLNSESGKVVQSLPEFVGEGTSITLDGNTVYMWYQQGLIAKDILTSKVLWRYERVPWQYTLAGNWIIVYSQCCKLALLDAQNGKVLWERDIDTNVIADIVVIKDTAYVMGDDGVIVAFDMTTGDEKGRLVTGPRSVAYSNKEVGMATNGTCLYATFGDRQVFAFC